MSRRGRRHRRRKAAARVMAALTHNPTRYDVRHPLQFNPQFTAIPVVMVREEITIHEARNRWPMPKTE